MKQFILICMCICIIKIITIEKGETSWFKTKSCWDPRSQSTDYLRSPRTVTTHGLVAFQVSDVWFRLQLFRTGTASVSAAVAVVASAAAHLVLPAAAPFCPQLLCQLLQDFPPGSPAAAAPWMRCRHWSLPGRGCYRRHWKSSVLPLTEYALAIWSGTSSPYLVLV